MDEVTRSYQSAMAQYRLPSEGKERFAAYQKQLTDDFEKSLETSGLDTLKQWQSFLSSESDPKRVEMMSALESTSNCYEVLTKGTLNGKPFTPSFISLALRPKALASFLYTTAHILNQQSQAQHLDQLPPYDPQEVLGLKQEIRGLIGNKRALQHLKDHGLRSKSDNLFQWFSSTIVDGFAEIVSAWDDDLRNTDAELQKKQRRLQGLLNTQEQLRTTYSRSVLLAGLMDYSMMVRDNPKAVEAMAQHWVQEFTNLIGQGISDYEAEVRRRETEARLAALSPYSRMPFNSDVPTIQWPYPPSNPWPHPPSSPWPKKDDNNNNGNPPITPIFFGATAKQMKELGNMAYGSNLSLSIGAGIAAALPMALTHTPINFASLGILGSVVGYMRSCKAINGGHTEVGYFGHQAVHNVEELYTPEKPSSQWKEKVEASQKGNKWVQVSEKTVEIGEVTEFVGSGTEATSAVLGHGVRTLTELPPHPFHAVQAFMRGAFHEVRGAMLEFFRKTEEAHRLVKANHPVLTATDDKLAHVLHDAKMDKLIPVLGPVLSASKAVTVFALGQNALNNLEGEIKKSPDLFVDKRIESLKDKYEIYGLIKMNLKAISQFYGKFFENLQDYNPLTLGVNVVKGVATTVSSWWKKLVGGKS